MRKLYFILLFLPVLGMAQQQLTVSVTGIDNNTGHINIGLYTSDESFLKSDKHYKGLIVKSIKGTTVGTFENLPKGTYAIAVFHDENSNEILDTNFFGIPKEPLGFSIGKLKTFGPPSFEDCSFILDKDMKISIPIN